jgi:hypothetical protein
MDNHRNMMPDNNAEKEYWRTKFMWMEAYAVSLELRVKHLELIINAATTSDESKYFKKAKQ